MWLLVGLYAKPLTGTILFRAGIHTALGKEWITVWCVSVEMIAWKMKNGKCAAKPNASINCYIFNCIITNIISNFLEYRSVVFRLYRPPSLAHTSFLLCYCFSDSNHKQIFQNICLHIYLLVDALSNSVMLSWLLWMCQIHSNASRRVLPTGHRYHRAPSGG